MQYLPLVAAYLACASSLALTNYVRRLAERNGFVDKPDQRRKTQAKPVALGGGVAILLSCIVTLSVITVLQFDQYQQIRNPSSLLGLAYASVLLCLVGLFDDLYGMRGVFKLIWQLVAASLIVTLGSGLAIHKLDLLGKTYEIGLIGVPLAMLWIVAAVNSLNLIDGMDGLATTVGLIFSVTLGILAMSSGDAQLEAVIAFCVAGALLGFLRHNGPPATIYLGDSGSMLIGVILGTLSLRCSFKEATATAVAAPLAVWAIPIFDSVAALIRRKLTGRSMYTTDRGHIHHRLLTRGLSNQQALFLIAGLCLITSIGAIISVRLESPWVGFASVVVVFALLIGTRAFGHSELILLNNRLVGFGRSLFSNSQPRGSSVRLQGTLDWESVWQGLIETALRNNYVRMRLNLYLPQYHEDFYASWKRDSDARNKWSSEVPLVFDDQQIGTLKVEGLSDDGSMTVLLTDFGEVVEQLEFSLAEIIARERGRRATESGSTLAPNTALNVVAKAGHGSAEESTDAAKSCDDVTASIGHIAGAISKE